VSAPARSLPAEWGHDLRHFEPVPLYIAKEKVARKWDVDCNEYVDFLMGNAALARLERCATPPARLPAAALPAV
jgi:glutamate-1-semialdehyde aminotransferase